MAKTISFSLDPNSIQNAVNELRQYQREFERKCQRFRELIAERVAWSASRGFSTALVDDTFLRIPKRETTERPRSFVPPEAYRVTKNAIPEQPKYGATIQVDVEHNPFGFSVVCARGEQAVFIEYGAGTYFNTQAGSSPHPWGESQGYLIGTFGHGNGRKKAWGFFDRNGDVLITHGTPAAMPMYRGVSEAIRAIDEIAREVFE